MCLYIYNVIVSVCLSFSICSHARECMHADTHTSHTSVHPYANLHTHQQHGHTHAIYKAIAKSKPSWPDLQFVCVYLPRSSHTANRSCGWSPRPLKQWLLTFRCFFFRTDKRQRELLETSKEETSTLFRFRCSVLAIITNYFSIVISISCYSNYEF